MGSRGDNIQERFLGEDTNKANTKLMGGCESDSKGVEEHTTRYLEEHATTSAAFEGGNSSFKDGRMYRLSSVGEGMIGGVGDMAITRQSKPVLEIGNGSTPSSFVPYNRDIHSVVDEKKLPTSACLTMSLGLYHAKSADVDGISLGTLNLPGILGGQLENYGDERKMSGVTPIRAKPRQLLPKQPPQIQQTSFLDGPKQLQVSLQIRSETPKEPKHVPLRVARPPVEGRGRNQLLPRYWPRITDQELQQITAGDSNSTITPLFEKMLSASDAGKIGRLVLPKACAETYFPSISQPEGLPLKIQDVSGKDWVFQFRFWPNNNSRMYVLEGVTPCIQSMQLQAGDTVTFSRLDPEGKLVMGYRRAPSSLSSQEIQPSTAALSAAGPSSVMGGSASLENFSTIAGLTGLLTNSTKSMEAQANGMAGHLSLSDTGYGWFRPEKAGNKAKEGPFFSSLLVGDKKKSRPPSSKNKRSFADMDDATEFRITWEEAQDLLRSPPNVAPSIVTIEGFEFEEYEEPPVFGKRTLFTTSIHGSGEDQWAQCDDCGSWRKVPADVFLPTKWVCSDNVWDAERNMCDALQEVDSEEIEFLVQQIKDSAKLEPTEPFKVSEPSSALEALANAAGGGDDNMASSSSPAATTKHPRHRPGCTCIVCIQPPSGKGPKHKPTCVCNVCMTVKRRFKTLMMRRKKRQSEREAEHAARKKRPWTKEEGGEVNGGGQWQNDGLSYSEMLPRQGNLVMAFPNMLPRVPNFPTTSNGNRFFPSVTPPTSYVAKTHLDLNIQPERGDSEASRSPFRVSMVKLLQNASHPLDSYLKEQGLTSLVSPHHVPYPTLSFGGSLLGRETDKRSGMPHTPASLSTERSQDELCMALGMARFDNSTDLADQSFKLV